MGTQRRTNSQPPQPDVDLTGEAPGGLCLSDERLLVAGQALQCGIWDWNLATSELDWTAELDAIYGLKPGTFGRTYSDFSKRVHPQDLGHMERCREDALAAGRPFDVAFRIIRPDGDIRWVRSAGDLHHLRHHRPKAPAAGLVDQRGAFADGTQAHRPGDLAPGCQIALDLGGQPGPWLHA